MSLFFDILRLIGFLFVFSGFLGIALATLGGVFYLLILFGGLLAIL
ncbi:MAG: hypothetical protein N2485_00380 [bacterium]|nr:hypothetical protein [bacterium]